MEITEVQIFPVADRMLKAFAAITIDDCFVVRDLKIIDGRKGIFVGMPSRKQKDGTFKDLAHPLNNETRQLIQKKVLNEYQKMMLERHKSFQQGS
jgi:stage V sporulation protein G